MRVWILNGLVMLALTFAMFRFLAAEVPHLPWERPAVVVTPSTAPDPGGPLPLRIGVGDRPAYLPLLAILDQLPAEAPRVQMIQVPDAMERWAMLADGRLDMACGTLDSFALASLHQTVGDYLFSIGTGAGEDVVMAQAGISRLTDLADKSIAVPRGGPGEYLLGLMLSEAGLSLSQCKIVSTATAHDAALLLEKNSVQAAFLWQPATDRVKALPGETMIANTADAKSYHADEMCAVSLSSLSKRHTEIVAVVRAYFKLIDSLKLHPGLTRGAISAATHLPAGALADYLKSVQFATLSDNRTLEPAAVAAALSEVQSNLRYMGRKPTVVNDISKTVHLELVKQLPSAGSDSE